MTNDKMPDCVWLADDGCVDGQPEKSVYGWDTPFGEAETKYHHNRVVEQLQAQNKALREALELASEVIYIATDWNAPSYYDVSIPEKLKETLQDKESDEPEWLCVYKFMSHIKQTLKGNE